MKKILLILSILVCTIALCSCGQAREADNGSEPKAHVCSADGYTVELVSVHCTRDGNGDPMAAIELTFQNDNAEPRSFMWVASATLFQDGIEMQQSGMHLERGFDWDSISRSVKDGGKITVFVPAPLSNTTDPVEVIVRIINNGREEASTSAEYEW